MVRTDFALPLKAFGPTTKTMLHLFPGVWVDFAGDFEIRSRMWWLYKEKEKKLKSNIYIWYKSIRPRLGQVTLTVNDILMDAFDGVFGDEVFFSTG